GPRSPAPSGTCSSSWTPTGSPDPTGPARSSTCWPTGGRPPCTACRARACRCGGSGSSPRGSSGWAAGTGPGPRLPSGSTSTAPPTWSNAPGMPAHASRGRSPPGCEPAAAPAARVRGLSGGGADGPGVVAVDEGLQVGGGVFLGGGDLGAGLVVVGLAVDLADDAGDGVLQVLAGQAGQGLGVGGVR